MRFHVGTSGYSYKEWKGSFYPEKLPQKEMLSYYAQRFSTVEINVRRGDLDPEQLRGLAEIMRATAGATRAPASIRT